MGKKYVLMLFILSQILLICCYIQLESRCISAQYMHQKNIKRLAELDQKKRSLEQQLHEATHLDTIDAYARNTLKLQPITRTQIKYIS